MSDNPNEAIENEIAAQEDSAPEDSDAQSDGAETPEVDGGSEPASDAAVTEDELEEADSAPEPDNATPPAVVGQRHSNLTSRAQRKHRQRGS